MAPAPPSVSFGVFCDGTPVLSRNEASSCAFLSLLVGLFSGGVGGSLGRISLDIAFSFMVYTPEQYFCFLVSLVFKFLCFTISCGYKTQSSTGVGPNAL